MLRPVLATRSLSREPPTQGVVDRQRPLTGAWLGHELPAAMTDPTPATLALTLGEIGEEGKRL